MIALKPEYELDKVPYASTIKFELYKDKKGKFHVASIYNGQTLQLGGCQAGKHCPIDTWNNYMNTRLTTNQADLDTKCAATPVDSDYENDKVPDWHFN